MAPDQKAYKRYIINIERALSLFDANSDWADYISFLSRLSKALDSGKPEGVVDISVKRPIALCLSRCLQPTLPSGVHQKALDVYAEIFSITSDLGRDLPLYLPGLSHSLSFVNLATRPLVLELFENHVLQLGLSTLRPALKALILSLLPVIEEETSEDFDRCLHIFDGLRLCFLKSSQESFFWQTLFVASIANPARRAGILVYLIRYLPRLSAKPEDENGYRVIITPEPGLLIRCFATGLRDQQPLIQRGFLDLLVTHLPLDATILQADAGRNDLDVLVRAATTIVLRRDMSLNRRLWAWLTGIDSKAADDSITSPSEPINENKQLSAGYFTRNSLPAIVRGIEHMLSKDSELPSVKTTPYRVMSSLMDRWEIGGPVVKATFAPLMQNLMRYQSSAPSQNAFDEVFRSANVFFDGVESYTLFQCLGVLLRTSQVDLISFILANFSIEQADRAYYHVTTFSKEVASMIATQTEENDNLEALSALLQDLALFLPPDSFPAASQLEADTAAQFFETVARTLWTFLDTPSRRLCVSGICSSFERAAMIAPELKALEDIAILEKVRQELQLDCTGDSDMFTMVDVSARIITPLLQRFDDLSKPKQQQVLDIVPDLVTCLWRSLDPSTPHHHVIAVETIWRLHDLTFKDEIVESSILTLLNHNSVQALSKVSDIERFGVLYHHSRTVKKSTDDVIPSMLRRATLQILDHCHGEDRNEQGVIWLSSLHDTSPVFKLVFITDINDVQAMAIRLQRVQKFVRIINLSDDSWQAFSTSPDLQLVHAFCLTLLTYQAGDDVDFATQAHILLRKLYGARSGNTPPEDLILLLVEKLDQSTAAPNQQEELLDTLLAVLNDKTILPATLVRVLLQGLSIVPTDERLDKWITLLCNFLPNHTALLPSLLKITSSFCQRIDQAFDDLKSVFDHKRTTTTSNAADRSITNILSGLEYVLARAHQKVSNNTLPSGQLTNGTPQDNKSSRAQANDRLTVILCMQDAVRICAKLWLWKTAPRTDIKHSSSDAKSFQYIATKLRLRSRKILENLIDAEPQECLETLTAAWADQEQQAILELLQTLHGARPRAMMPAIFIAIYSRNIPGILSLSQKSTVSIQIGPLELSRFLNAYTSALEDDMLEEIWTDCASFLREVLGNPMPHRQILIRLVRFCAILSRKMENTSFSEESRMHRELADLCARLFTAIFTIKPVGFDGATSTDEVRRSTPTSLMVDNNMLDLLVNTLPHLGPLLAQSDRLNTVYGGISGNIVTPALHSKAFPSNLTLNHLEITRLMSSSSGTSKTWKKDVIDAFINPKLFQGLELAKHGWLPLFKELQSIEKTILGDCLTRIAPPAAAGLVLGIGAAAARHEADRKTQLELRRVGVLLLSGGIDASLPYLQQILQKIEDLFTATLESSPSLATRGDTYLLLRAVLLKVSHSNLVTTWPLIDAELQSLCKDILSGGESKYPAYSKLQGAKLLDLLLMLRPDEFQLHEWLYVTDTIDAIYPPAGVESTAFADQIGPAIQSHTGHLEPQALTSATQSTTRRPWFHGRAHPRDEDVNSTLASFFGQLSIRAFEDLYSLQPVDEVACLEDVVVDVFTDVS